MTSSSPAAGQCTCAEGSVFSQDITLDSSGKQTYALSCVACAAGEYPGPGWECKKCPYINMEYTKTSSGYDCQCKTGFKSAGVDCVSDAQYNTLTGEISDIAKAKQVIYRNVIGPDGQIKESPPINSDLFNQYFTSAAIGCQTNTDPVKCQQLANLCVLQLYDRASEACAFYTLISSKIAATSNNIYNDISWKDGLPWLFYGTKPLTLLKTSLKS